MSIKCILFIVQPKVKKEEKPVEKWKWWEENNGEKLPEGRRWRFLEHKGPVFAPPYIPLPENIKMKYKGLISHITT